MASSSITNDYLFGVTIEERSFQNLFAGMPGATSETWLGSTVGSQRRPERVLIVVSYK
jgi:hypothetical protein